MLECNGVLGTYPWWQMGKSLSGKPVGVAPNNTEEGATDQLYQETTRMVNVSNLTCKSMDEQHLWWKIFACW